MVVNILLCDTFPGLLPASIPSYPWMFARMFDSVKTGSTYRVFDVWNCQFPGKCNSNELYVVTGSNSGVYEEEKWIKILLTFIRYARDISLPLVGICFGHQAIAQALGGKVERAQEKGWGTGIRQSRILHPIARDYFDSETMALHYNHHDQVVELPQNATVFATSDFCQYEGMMIGNHILTFQGHPEYTDEYNRHLLLNHSADEDDNVKRKAIESIETLTAMGDKAARWMLDMVHK